MKRVERFENTPVTVTAKDITLHCAASDITLTVGTMRHLIKQAENQKARQDNG